MRSSPLAVSVLPSALVIFHVPSSGLAGGKLAGSVMPGNSPVESPMLVAGAPMSFVSVSSRLA